MTQQQYTPIWPNVRRPAPTALPMEYDIERIPGTALYELRFYGLTLDRLPSIGDAVEAGLAHAALVDAEWSDTGMGDQHICTPYAPFESYCDGAGHAFGNFMNGVEARDCAVCNCFHLVPEQPAGRFEVD